MAANYDLAYEYEPPKVKYPICPECGAECSEIYKDKWGQVCGCDQCISCVDAWEWAEDELR